MKVGLFTYHFSDNYGALFQAWALREWFKKQGIDAEFVNYHPRYVEEGGNFDALMDPRKWKKNLTIAYLKATHFYWSVFGSSQQKALFDNFRSKYLGVTGPRLLNAEDLQFHVDADLLVCGSDQVWNPSIQKGLDPVYFLVFDGAKNARRISYAPSFGRGELATEYHTEAGNLISKLDGISVREESGINIIKQVSGRNAVCVPDPTILLGDFSSLLKGSDQQAVSHVFCYALRTDKVIRDVAESIAEIKGIRLLNPISVRQRWKSIGTGIEPGPVEWLQLLNTATTVVTNSFHGVALSIILNRPFVAIALPGKKAPMNERVRSLLKHTNLLNRLITSVDAVKVEQVISTPIDWEAINQRLSELRRSGEFFLQQQIRLCKVDE